MRSYIVCQPSWQRNGVTSEVKMYTITGDAKNERCQRNKVVTIQQGKTNTS